MELIQLNTVCNFKQWKTIPTKELKDNGFPVWGANGIIGYSDEYNHTDPTIMICCRGATCGAINVSSGKCYINGNAMCVDNLSEEYAIDFVAYFLKHYDFSGIITGAAQPQITQNGLAKIFIPKMSIAEQNYIASNLRKIEKSITLKEQELHALDDLVKSRFIEMFGDPQSNDKQFPTKRVIDIVTLQRGHDLPVQNRDNSGVIPVYGSNGVLGVHNISKCSRGIITGRSGTIGEVYVSEEPFWPLNTTLYSIDTHDNNLVYLKYLLIFFDLKRFMSGAGVPTLNRNEFHGKDIMDVPIVLQNEFAEFVKLTDKSKFIVQKQIEDLQELLDSKMDEYFG